MTTPCADLLLTQGTCAGAHETDRVLASALRQALGPGLRLHFPRMPDEGAPDNDVWREAISTALRRTPATFLVAHSAGGAIAADLLVQGGDRPAELASLWVPPSHDELYGRLFPAAVMHRLPGCGHQFDGWTAQLARDLRALAPA